MVGSYEDRSLSSPEAVGFPCEAAIEQPKNNALIGITVISLMMAVIGFIINSILQKIGSRRIT